jgi:hypothetical protein
MTRYKVYTDYNALQCGSNGGIKALTTVYERLNTVISSCHAHKTPGITRGVHGFR